MDNWLIYTKSGAIRLHSSTAPEYSGTWMGSCFVTISVKSAEPVDFAFGDYILYRGEKFVLDYDPTVIKKARRGTHGEGFSYDSIRFYALSNELTQIRFRDLVLGDNHIHYTSLPTFSFYAVNIDDLADRLQANTDKWCEDNGFNPYDYWKFITPNKARSLARGVTLSEYNDAYGEDASFYTEGEKFDVVIDINNVSVWDSLANIKEKFGLNFTMRNRTCVVGAAGIPTNHLFKYGKDNGLYEIERVADSEQAVVTKLTAYGDTENMPLRYYATIGEGLMPNNMAINCLMLPGFPKYALDDICQWRYDGDNDKTLFDIRKTPTSAYSVFMELDGYCPVFFSEDAEDPYLLADNFTVLGIKEGTVSFTEENDDNGLKKVYPSIEGMTVGDLNGTTSTERLDEVVSATVITDNGVFGEGDTEPEDFEITLKDLGFDLKEAFENGDSQMVIAMKDGYCGGREFSVSAVRQNANGTWVCTCAREHDDLLDLWFPYSYNASVGDVPTDNEPYQIRTGDHFVLTGIYMTDTSYIWAASVKLLRKSIAWLLANNYTRYTYLPKVDEIFMARQHDMAIASDSRSLHDTLKEGDVMLFEDGDLDISGSVFIDSLRIKEGGNGMIPTYEVTLRNDKQVGTIQRMQNQISSLTSFVNHGGGGFSAAQIREFIASYGGDLFLSKLNSDTAQSVITFLQGIALGDGTYYIDGNGDAVLRDINAQNALFESLTAQEAHFFNLIIDEVKSVGGQMVITPANCIADLVEPVPGENDRLRVFFKAQDSDRSIDNQWQIGDQAVHYEFDTTSGTSRNYWRLVVGVSDDTVEKNIDGVSLTCHWIDLSLTDCKDGSSGVMAGDHISMLGNRTDTSRQNAIIISAYNIPFIDTAPYLGHAQGIQAPLFASYTGINSFTITESNRKNVIAGNGNLFTGTLSVRSTLADGRPVNDLGTEEGNLLRNTAFTGDYESEPSAANVEMTEDTLLWSDPFNHWEYDNAQATDYSDAKSGRCVSLTNGYISQYIENISGNEWYMLSFYASGNNVSVSALGYAESINLTPARTRYDIAFKSANSAETVALTGTCIISDIILTKGTLPVEWSRSPLDPDSAKLEDMANDYLRKAITEASTTINGGLVLTQMLKMGMFRRDNNDGVYKMSTETGGLSGVMNNGDSPYAWGGGTLQQAINAIDYYKYNPTGEPTSEDLETFAKFVVTHGGRAIMEDVILRGYVYALGGKFKGEVEALSGIFKNITSPNGSFSIDNSGTLKIVNMLVEELGKIASAIFSGDYMISQYGRTAAGLSTNNYEDFDPEDPDNPLKFVPNIYFNFLTGKAHLTNADISGTIRMLPKHVFGSTDFNMLFEKDNTSGDYYFIGDYPKVSLQLYYMPTDGKVYVCSWLIASDPSTLHYEGLEFTVFNISGVDYYIEEFTNFTTQTTREKRIGSNTMAKFKIVAVHNATWGYLYSPVLESLYEI